MTKMKSLELSGGITGIDEDIHQKLWLQGWKSIVSGAIMPRPREDNGAVIVDVEGYRN